MATKQVVRKVVSLNEAKANLSRLVDEASEGAEIIISKSGRPKARLVPLEQARRRIAGFGKGRWKVSRNFDAPL